jgi:hypothetical protein
VKFDCRGVAALAYRWKRYNEIVLRAMSEHPDRFITLRYEDLTAAPEESLTRVCEHFGVDFDPAMLQFHEGKSVTQASWHKNLKSPINTGSVRRWVEFLSEGEISIAEKICGERGAEFGYETTLGELRRLPTRDRMGQFNGWLTTELERLLFVFPLRLRSLILRAYRKLTS